MDKHNLDLNLDNLKVGDEIVTVRPKKNGLDYGPVRIVTEWNEKFKRWRFAIPGKLDKNVGAFPTNGYGLDFMSKNPDADYYYSANPKHIKAAKKKMAEIKAAREERETELARREALAFPIGDLLKTEYYDREECYHLDTTSDIVSELVSRLTDEQIITLKGWLNL